MLQLQTLGGLRITSEDAALGPAARQPRGLALLALLAGSGDQPTSRDRVLACLWSEIDQETAAHRLAQLVYSLRRDLGSEVMRATKTDLGLDPFSVVTDWAAFDAAVRAGAPERAATLYSGPFLDGFFLRDAPEFERWAEEQRGHLARRHLDMLERAAAAAMRRADHAAAVEWWRRLATADPLSSRAAAGLMEALAAAGRRGDALRFAAEHEALVRRELSTPPGASVTGLAARLRISPAPGPPLVLSERYVVEREVGRGGMGTVYLAWDPRHERRVAVKVIRPEIAGDLGAERFVQEIKLAARLQHPNIVPLFDSGTVEGRPGEVGPVSRPFYVMPFVAGESLRARLSREAPLPAAEAVRLGRELADALDYAHRQGIVHRDIKPENILLEDGHALVADFGLARAIAGSAPEGDGDSPPSVAQTLGASPYSSPEQREGSADLDGRSDIYSLGCVLYEMLTGRLPDAAAHGELPPFVGDAVLQALAASPAERFQRAGDFGAALAATAPFTPPRPTESLDAYTTFLKGWRGLHDGPPRGFAEALDCFHRSVELDPGFAVGHSACGYALTLAGFDEFALSAPHEAMPKARAAALHAHQLDPGLADAHAVLGMVAMLYDWNWEDAEREFQLAERLGPGAVPVYFWHGNLLITQRRFDEAWRILQRGQALDPMNTQNHITMGRVHYYARRYDEAALHFRAYLEVDQSYIGWAALARVYLMQGRVADTLAALQQGLRANGPVPLLIAYEASASGLAGDQARALDRIEELARLAVVQHVPALYQAIALQPVGDLDDVLRLYERAYEERSGWLCWLAVDPGYELFSMHPDSRCGALIRSLRSRLRLAV
jgi:serine/threonine-protein kinase